MAQKYTFLHMAQEVLSTTTAPLSSKELWELAVKLGLDTKLGSQGLTPWHSLKAALLVDTRDNVNSVFLRQLGSPAKFSLRKVLASQSATEQVISTNGDGQISPEPPGDFSVERVAKYPYKERELHSYLSWFAKYGLGAVVTKTIFHESSSKKNWSEWLHPDLVGFWFPFSDYNSELLALSLNGMSIARFYSFELKRELTFGNLRESFFQAVSNSSWAHEGYLVAANIDESETLISELSRLSGSFGIGVIELALDDPERSSILCPARRKTEIDWEGANKLAKESPDFRHFLTSARIDIANSKLHHVEYDLIPQLEDLRARWVGWHTETS